MVKVKGLSMILILIILLTGCISIPIGDQVLEISQSGISFTSD